MSSEPVRAMVLSGGGARGAYEAGVLAYIYKELPANLLQKNAVRIFSGTSVGAVHACFLAGTADLGRNRVDTMLKMWQNLNIEQLLRLRAIDFLNMPGNIRSLFKQQEVDGIVINARKLQELVVEAIPWANIRRNMQQGLFDALTVSATHVASGKTVVFIDRVEGGIPPWTRDHRRLAQGVHMGPLHALASAAIPVLFPAICIDGVYYCDGGLRQNTPLSPALRLGADRTLVITLSHGRSHDTKLSREPEQAESYPGPFLLLGKIMNALLLDHLDYDLSRLKGINQLLEDGTAAFGASFIDRLNQTTEGVRGAGYRPVETTVIRPSRDLGEMANEWLRHQDTDIGGMPGWILKKIARQDKDNKSDLLSYMCFDGRMASSLIELGMADADAARSQLIEFFRE